MIKDAPKASVLSPGLPGKQQKHREPSARFSPTRYVQMTWKNLRQASTTWFRVIMLFWRCSPGLTLTLAVLMAITGVLPALQVQVTRNLTDSVVAAIQYRHNAALPLRAVEWGLIEGGLAIVSLLLGNAQQYTQNLLQMQLGNKISIQIMEKAITLDIQHFEDHTLY